jgi:hypothetical protein
MDSDRNGTLSFEEFCFRFGRKFQMELAQQRRVASGSAAPSIQVRVQKPHSLRFCVQSAFSDI